MGASSTLVLLFSAQPVVNSLWMQRHTHRWGRLINGILLARSSGPKHFENAVGRGWGKPGVFTAEKKEKPGIVLTVPFCTAAAVSHLISGQSLSQACNILVVSLSCYSLLITGPLPHFFWCTILQANKKTHIWFRGTGKSRRGVWVCRSFLMFHD